MSPSSPADSSLNASTRRLLPTSRFDKTTNEQITYPFGRDKAATLDPAQAHGGQPLDKLNLELCRKNPLFIL